MTEEWDGKERREYCAQHCRIVEDSKNATPWKVFIFTTALFLSSMGALIAYHQKGMEEVRVFHDKFKVEINARLIEMETHLHDKVRRIEATNDLNFKRVFDRLDAVSKNLQQLKTQNEVIKIKQELVLKKIRITE